MPQADLLRCPNCRIRHQTEIFSTLLSLYERNSPLTGEFPSQRPVTRGFDVSLSCAWTNVWVNTRGAGDLICHRAHYDVTIMRKYIFIDNANKMFMISILMFCWDEKPQYDTDPIEWDADRTVISNGYGCVMLRVDLEKKNKLSRRSNKIF